MSIWMLLLFAISMLSAVASFRADSALLDLALPVFVVTLLAFLVGLAMRGIRRPVV